MIFLNKFVKTSNGLITNNVTPKILFMKVKGLFVAIVLLMIAFACKKNTLPPNESTILTGDWEFRSSVGGERLPITDSPGNGTIYSFANTTYKYFEKNIIHDSGTYSITQKNNPYTGQPSSAVSLKSSLPELFLVNGDTLTLDDEGFEPVVNTYVKISK